jgi:Ser/Thr protein kinase RdoA (MazF antagonist)
MNMSWNIGEHNLLLNRIAQCYGIEQAQLRCLTDNSDDGVYGFTRQGQDFVVKYTLQAVRSFSTLQSQIAWVNFLTAHGVPASRPVPSRQGLLVEQVHIADTLVSVVCYVCVPGDRPEGKTLTAELFQMWGQVLGQIHALSTQYVLPQQHEPIDQWYEGAQRDRRVIPADQRMVLEKFDALIQYFHALPKDQQSYGLIHGDFQANNLRVDQGVLRVFDFDACEFNWFVSDIATSLYFTLWERPPEQSNAAFGSFVLENILVGYTRERSLGDDWVEQIPIFLKLQEMYIYMAINELNQVADGTNIESLPPKHRDLLSRYRYNIENDVSYIQSAYCPWSVG